MASLHNKTMPMFRVLLTIFVIGTLFISIAETTLAVDQVKTVETFVDSSVSTLTTHSLNFTVYIGDNISGVTNPIKAAYFIVSGVYTGSGSLAFTINSSSSQTFTLPDVVATPTPFELLYKDTSSVINPTSAGSYTYSFGVTVSGVTVYGYGAKLYLTYRYIPASCQDGTTDKVKSVETFVGNSTSSFSAEIDPQFSVYIGDDIGSVVAPAVKSVYFSVAGVYTGNGTLKLQLNSDINTAQTYTLPNAGVTPTPFEILYKDLSTPAPGKINPISSGTYSYTFNVIPSGVTIYGFGASVNTTYRYKPPSCGGNPFGDLTSAVFDTALDGAAYNSFTWKGTTGTGKVGFQLATSNVSTGPWTFIGGATCAGTDFYFATGADAPIEISCAGASHNNQRYFKYKVRICKQTDCTTGTGTTPQVDDVIVSWSP